MSDIKNLIVTEFLANEREYLARAEQELREVPMTYEEKLNHYETILKKGIAFGIDKGVFLEQTRRDKIERAKRAKKERLLDELIFDLNDDIMKFKNLPKIKYNKKKYRHPKGIIQLNFLKELGYNVDVV